MSVNKELLQRKVELEQDLSRSFIINSINPIHTIYFDLPLLQDVYIGALLLHCKNENEYNTILARIPYYLSRVDNDICKYFPTRLTDDYLLNFIKDPKNGEMLFKASPHTNLWFTIKHLIGMIIEKNRVIDGNDFHCDILVNTHKVGYPPLVYKWMSNYLKNITVHLTLKTVNLPIEKLPQRVRLTPELYFLEDVSILFSSESPLIEESCRNTVYSEKYIFAKRVVTTKTTADIETVFEKSKHFCNIFTNFDYLDISIPGVQYIPPVLSSTDKSMKETNHG